MLKGMIARSAFDGGVRITEVTDNSRPVPATYRGQNHDACGSSKAATTSRRVQFQCGLDLQDQQRLDHARKNWL